MSTKPLVVLLVGVFVLPAAVLLAVPLVFAAASTPPSGTCAASPTGCAGPATIRLNLPAGFAGALVSAAAREIGAPYVWGGGSYTGATGGGFDCSGLVMYAAYQASEGTLRLPHFTGDQVAYGTPVAWANREPGDLVFFSYSDADVPHHVAIYLGGNEILQAPRSGEAVRYGTLSEFAGQVLTFRRLSGHT